MELFSKTVGADATLPRLAYLHGLFGQGKNFNSVARTLADDFHGLLIDLPNHGHSPHTDSFSYIEMADAVAEHLRGGFAGAGRVHVVGHSMGGKVAMVLALRHPDLVDKLIVEDSAPVSWGALSQFDHLLSSLKALNLDTISDRSDASEALEEAIPEAGVRLFLLQNLRQRGGAWTWLANLDMLHDHLPEIGGFPDLDATFDRPTLWMGGETSDYTQADYTAQMEALFPRTLQVTIKGAGHWIHSEQPAAFTTACRTFLK